jgi:microcompartment protein CcmK/EutM
MGQVVGRVWNDREHPDFEQQRFVAVRGLDDSVTIAVDLVMVSAGNLVLVATDEAAQIAVGHPSAIDAAVVALVSGADELDELMSGRDGT